MKNACNKRGDRRDRKSQAASISDDDNDDNGAWNVLRIARNFKPAAVKTNTNNGGANASSNFIGI